MTMMSSLKAFLFALPAQGGMTRAVAVPSAGADGREFAALLGGITQPTVVPGPDSALPMPTAMPPVFSEGEALDRQESLPSTPLAVPLGDMCPIEKPEMDGRVAVAIAPTFNARDCPDGEPEADIASIEKDDDADRPEAKPKDALMASVVPTESPIALPPAVPVPAPEAKSTNASDVKAFAAVTAPRNGSEESIAATIVPSRSPDPQSAVASQQAMPVPLQGERATHLATHLAARPTGDVSVRPVDPRTENTADPAVIKIVAAAPLSSPTVPSVPGPVPVKASAPIIPPPTAPALGTPERTFEMSVDGEVPALTQPANQRMSQTTSGVPVPAKSEALSLLQLVREHFVRRDGVSRPAESASPVPVAHGDDQVSAEQAFAEPLTIVPSSPLIASAPTAASGPVQTPSAAVDLAGTITGQVVDMGVQGQWIDGLAKDIASLSANGAQGKFQIRSDHLGAVQVEIRPGATGAVVSLTVASDAAQQALQSDGDRLIADTALSAMKITDLRIERGPINEAPRADNAGQQQSGNNGQSQAQNQAQSGSQAMSQGQGQGLSQGTGQNRQGQHDNFSGNHKSGPDSAVLSRADSREGESTAVHSAASRARYA